MFILVSSPVDGLSNNLETCLSGKYPSLCKLHFLTQEEKIQVKNAENLDNLKTCLSGKYQSLCNHKLLSPMQLKLVRRLEEIER